MKWFWRIYKINGSFDLAIKEIGGCPFKNLDRRKEKLLKLNENENSISITE